MIRLFTYAAGVLALAACVTATAHPNRAGLAAKPVVGYDVVDGMSQGEVNHMIQDSSGYLWIATRRGLNRFDGATFEHLTVSHGMRANNVSAVLETRSRQIWAGDDYGGLTLIEGMRVTDTVDPPADQQARILSLAEVNDQLFAATVGFGIFRLDEINGQRTLNNIGLELATVDQLVATGAGGLLALAGEQLYLIDLAGQPQLQLLSEDIATVWSAGSNILIGRNSGEIGRWQQGQLSWLTGPLDEPPQALVEDRQGRHWVATSDQVFPLDSNLPSIDIAGVELLLVDREGVLWMSSVSGLYRHLGSRIDHYWLKLDDESPQVFSITGDSGGTLYFGATSGLYRRLPNSEVEWLNSTLPIPGGAIRDLLMADDNRRIWAAIEDQGLVLIDPASGQIEQIAETSGITILDLHKSRDGRIWMGTRDDGLFHYDPRPQSLTEISQQHPIFSLTTQGHRWLWYGVDDVGVFKLDMDSPGLAPQLILSTDTLGRTEFNQLSVQGEGLWIATTEGGIFYFDGQTLQSPGGGPIADQSLYVVEALPDGTIMIGTETGIYQLDPQNKNYMHYGQLAGFLGAEANVHASYFDPEGHLWVGTMAGAARIRTDLPMPITPPPAARVSRVEAGDELLPIPDGGQVAADFRKVKITFGAVSTRHPTGLEYRYWLIGSDPDWSAPDTAQSVSFSNLSGGDYEFKVQARKPAGQWGPPSQWHFTVLTPVWRKTWFPAALVVSLMLLTVALMRYRNRRVALSNLRLRKEVADRTRSIEDARVRLEKSNRQLEYQASYDELTGLYNRRSFQEKLKQAWSEPLREGLCCYLMYLDLDQFKIVNDTCGHAAGDQLLRQISSLIRGKVRTADTVGRLGGDEFGIVIMHCPTDAALRVAEAIRHDVEDFQFLWDAEIFRIGVSIGVVPIETSRGDINELQQLADAACYAAKESGRNQVHLVSDDSDQAQKHRGEMRWVKRLHDAMEHNLFALYEQKIVPLHDSHEPERVEVLLRMREPESRKLIPPGAFLPAAERYGLGVKMDEWVVTNLLKSLFVHAGFNAQGRRYWINLSGLSMGDAKFCDTLLALMAKSELPPGMINFEITETAVIRNITEASRLIDALRDMGCEFALDDFGSGLSSFGYLKKLKVDYLKIDGMFVRDIVHDQTDRIFVKSIIDIAHTLNIRTVAEFVENDEILAVVKSLGADYAQGFGVSRPKLLAPLFPPLPETGTNARATR